MMMPHHGDLNNYSSNFKKIFKPDIMGISAGNGQKYRHPCH